MRSHPEPPTRAGLLAVLTLGIATVYLALTGTGDDSSAEHEKGD